VVQNINPMFVFVVSATYRVHLGEHTLSTTSGDEQDIDVAQVIFVSYHSNTVEPAWKLCSLWVQILHELEF
jgi:hypothetical protein